MQCYFDSCGLEKISASLLNQLQCLGKPLDVNFKKISPNAVDFKDRQHFTIDDKSTLSTTTTDSHSIGSNFGEDFEDTAVAKILFVKQPDHQIEISANFLS